MVRFGALGLSHHDIDAIRQEAMQFAGIGLLTIGPDGTIIYADRGILRIFELEDRYPDVVSAVGLVAGDILGCGGVLVGLAESAKARGRLHAMECQITTARGTRKWLLCDAYGLPASGQPFEAVQLMMRDISPRKRVQEQIARLNQCLLHLGTDTGANINMLTAMAGDLLGADCALYNRLSKGMLCSIGQWQTPAGYDPTVRPDGHLCYDVIKGGAAEPVVVRDLPSTPYASTDPNVSLHGLRTYIGVAVRRMDEPVGSLCVVYRRDFEPAADDLALLAIVASAVGIEESQDIETGRVLESNPALQGLLGYSAAELETLRVHDFVAHEDDDIAESIRRVVSEGRVFIGERLYRRKDGSLVEVEVSASLVRYRGRDALSVVSRDMTERSRALRSLRESEKKYRDLVEQSLLGIVVAQSPPTRLVFANEAIGTILGYTTAELTSLSPEDIPVLVHPEDRGLFFQRFEDRLVGRPLGSGYEFRGVRKDGTTCWLEISSSRIEYGGRPAVQATFLDISGRKQAEASLRQSEARYRTTLEAMSDAIHVVDRDLRILLFNQAFRAWIVRLGLPKDPIGQTLFEVFPFLPAAVEDEYRRVFVTGELLVTEETSSVADRQITTETRKIPMVENGVVVSVVTAIRDITDRRNSERALRESEERYRGLFDNATDL
ncbi:MAG: PAS domain S-box protein, partial [Candidatus Eisenbacteria bacterium]|nr:PAS domain S-box protein [Candidatus Eisenbacteria bacterium]